MNLDTNLKPIIPKDLLIDRAISKDQNRYNEDVYLLYNPVGYGGIVAVGQEIVDLIQAFDGATDISTAIAKSRLVGEDVVKANKFIQYLIQNDFLIAKEYIQKSKKHEWTPELTCWLHITNDCNLRCKYCYIHKTHSNMPNCIIYQSIDKMLESCKKHHYANLSLMLVGGEPLMRFDIIKEITNYIDRKERQIDSGTTEDKTKEINNLLKSYDKIKPMIHSTYIDTLRIWEMNIDKDIAIRLDKYYMNLETEINSVIEEKDAMFGKKKRYIKVQKSKNAICYKTGIKTHAVWYVPVKE